MIKKPRISSLLVLSVFILCFFWQGCSNPSRVKSRKRKSLYPQAKDLNEKEPKSLVNPNLNSENRKHKRHFINPYEHRYRSRFGVERRDYNTAIRNADSGHAYDAFIASLAYWSGHYRKGKRLIYFGKGRDKEKSLKYLHLASDLGWPEASYMLYQCYRDGNSLSDSYKFIFNMREKSFPPGNLSRTGFFKGCLHSGLHWRVYGKTSKKFVRPLDNKKARKYLERTAAQGANFDKDFNLKSKQEIPEFDRLDTRINMIINQYRFESLAHLANQKATESGVEPTGFLSSKEDRVVYQEDFSSCWDLYPKYQVKSAYEDEVICSKGSSDKRFCPGQGYQYMRYLLNACMILAPDKDQWEYFFVERLKFFHPYNDGRPYRVKKFLNPVIEKYKKLGEKTKVDWVKGIKRNALSNAENLASTWKYEKAKRYAENRVDRERRLRQERRDEKASIAYQKKFNAMMKKNRAEDRRLKKSWRYTPDNFSEKLQQVQNKTLERIRASKVRMYKSRAAPILVKKVKSRAPEKSMISPKSKVAKSVKNKKQTRKSIPFTVRLEPKNAWDTQKEACAYAKQKVIAKAKEKCKKEYKGTPATKKDVNIPVDANCQSYRQVEAGNFRNSKGQWKVTGNVIFYCRLPSH